MENWLRFNDLVAAVLDQDPAVHGGRRVVFLVSDDDGAAAEIALAEKLGFAPIKLGGLGRARAGHLTDGRHRCRSCGDEAGPPHQPFSVKLPDWVLRSPT